MSGKAVDATVTSIETALVGVRRRGGNSATRFLRSSVQESSNLPAILIGKLVGFEAGHPKVTYPGNDTSGGLTARLGAPLSPNDIGEQVMLAFENGDKQKPIVLGRLLAVEDMGDGTPPLDVRVDGERVRLTANREVVLRCGEASITLTRAGKVIIKGSYVLSRSTGYNKTKGAAVDIN